MRRGPLRGSVKPAYAVLGLVIAVMAAVAWHAARKPGGAVYDAQATRTRLEAGVRARGHPARLGQAVPWLPLHDPEGHVARHDLPVDGRPTVIWFWSVGCRCVADCEERIVALLDRFPEDTLRFFAIDSNPDDSAHAIHKKRMSMGSPYEVYRDVNGLAARHLRIDASASVAILDREGRLRFHGAIDDDLYEPTVSYVQQTLEALLNDQEPPRTTARSYGCRYPMPDGALR